MSEHKENIEVAASPCLMSRRHFLGAAGAAAVTLFIAPPWGGKPVAHAATQVVYPRKKIGTISGLKADMPAAFQYPDELPTYSDNLLIKLGEPAGGGVGPDRDIVAFSTLCSHMGGIMSATYKAADKVLGPCPTHLSTFDLTRHGMIVSGHATQSLPQVVLETDGDDIYAVGMLGLIYGRNANT